MWSDSPFASPRGSFQRPVLPPNIEPDAGPTKSVIVSCAWLPFIRGALQQLLLQSTWDSNVTDLLTTQERVFKLIDFFDECSGGLALACYDDFANGSQNGWVPWSGNAIWSGNRFDEQGGACIVKKHFSTPIDLFGISFRSEWDGTCPGSATAAAIWDGDPPTSGNRLLLQTPISPGSQVYSWNGTIVGVTDVIIGVNEDTASCSPGGLMTIDAILITYASSVGCQ